MILDSSVLIAILLGESHSSELVRRIQSADFSGVGTPTLAEAGLVLHGRLGEIAAGMLERLLDELSVEELPFGELHWREAVEAFRRFGKGQHAAALNFGDCLTYATASLSGQPLLFVGDDFSQTDIEAA